MKLYNFYIWKFILLLILCCCFWSSFIQLFQLFLLFSLNIFRFSFRIPCSFKVFRVSRAEERQREQQQKAFFFKVEILSFSLFVDQNERGREIVEKNHRHHHSSFSFSFFPLPAHYVHNRLFYKKGFCCCFVLCAMIEDPISSHFQPFFYFKDSVMIYNHLIDNSLQFWGHHQRIHVYKRFYHETNLSSGVLCPHLNFHTTFMVFSAVYSRQSLFIIFIGGIWRGFQVLFISRRDDGNVVHFDNS